MNSKNKEDHKHEKYEAPKEEKTQEEIEYEEKLAEKKRELEKQNGKFLYYKNKL